MFILRSFTFLCRFFLTKIACRTTFGGTYTLFSEVFRHLRQMPDISVVFFNGTV